MKLGHNNKDQLFSMNTPCSHPSCSTITFSGPILFKWIHTANKLMERQIITQYGGKFSGSLRMILDKGENISHNTVHNFFKRMNFLQKQCTFTC